MRIDMHVHVTPPDLIKDWQKIGEREPYFRLLSESPINKFATAEDIVETMEQDGFDKAVIFGFGFQDMGLCRYVNDYVMEKIREFPDRLIGFASVLPQHPEVDQELIRCFEGGLCGVGEIFPQGQGFALESPKEMGAFGGTCTELEIPVMFHLNEPVGHYYAGKTETSLAQAEMFARNFPDLKVILAHWGGGLFFYELMKEVSAELANVYYDTAASIFLYGHKVYNVVKTLGLTDKILFGSDYPLLAPHRYLADIEKSDLSQEEKDAILGGNAEKLLSGLLNR
ncbi:MAG: amidohydrolase [Clostridiaceae bacterium]|jgi:predicted TIM-barrel fold metal-dependent hydrolase|nr:amidohydrolase [Clostridiaceae bacterium]